MAFNVSDIISAFSNKWDTFKIEVYNLFQKLCDEQQNIENKLSKPYKMKCDLLCVSNSVGISLTTTSREIALETPLSEYILLNIINGTDCVVVAVSALKEGSIAYKDSSYLELKYTDDTTITLETRESDTVKIYGIKSEVFN